MSQDNQIYSLERSRRHDQLVGGRLAGNRRRVRLGLAGRRAGHGRRRLLFGRAQRLSLRKRPPGVAGRAAAHEHPTSVSSLSDIDADPVIDNGQVFAVGQGGRMVALELTTGQRLWELNIAGIATPWVAGDWVFVVTDEAKLLCIYRQNGHIRWINQLPQFRAGQVEEGPDRLFGPGPCRRPPDRRRLERRADQRRSRRPATSRARPSVGAGVSLAAGRRQLDALRLRRQRPAHAFR